jgi:hypothetical protein
MSFRISLSFFVKKKKKEKKTDFDGGLGRSARQLGEDQAQQYQGEHGLSFGLFRALCITFNNVLCFQHSGFELCLFNS